MKKIIPILSVFIVLACTKTERIEVVKEYDSPKIDQAIAVVHSVEDGSVMGTVTFDKTENGSKVSAQITGLSNGKHGFHIHQFGDCSASDFTSAGGHFNPNETEHDAPSDDTKHVGDLGNLQGKGNEYTSFTLNSQTIFLEEIVGRSIIIHAGEDDLTSQPSGDAGARIGCGVIGVAQ